jgi:adenine-specific DNA-methyltransferase
MNKKDIKLTSKDPETYSPDILAENVARLKELFPELITEGAQSTVVNVDVLKGLVGDQTVTDADEKFGLTWHGKRLARQLALTPSTGTLRPCPEDSVDWDKTQNLMIEGDNLEVLKLLQKSYAGRVKLIYIDPPYNTGKDFVYPDNYQDSIKNYQELTGQLVDGQKISSNTESSGRFHTDWLNMMYPRLKAAHALLRHDGLLIVSIDDNEARNLRAICDDIFGEENFLAQVVWQKIHSTKNDAKYFSESHEYLIVYARSIDQIDIKLLPRTEGMNARFANPDNDSRGPWASADLVANEERSQGYFDVIGPTGRTFNVPKGKHWLYSHETMQSLIAEGRIWFGKNGDAFPRLKRYLKEIQQGRKCDTIWLTDEVGSNQESKREVNAIFGGEECFNNPKPVRLIRRCLELGTETDSTVLDFFAGSGTTGHAVMAQNTSDGGNRRYILVQLPEPLDPTNKDQKIPSDFCDKLKKPRNIAELTKERLRRSAKKIKEENPLFAGDLGFRVFKLDSSNIRAWDPERNDLPKTLEESVQHLKTDRTETDILYELLLKLGLDLCVPIEQKKIAGKTVHSIGAGVLLACLAENIARADVEPLAQGIIAWYKVLAPAGDTACVFRDAAFEDDVAKTNLAAILNQNGLTNVRSL